MADTKRTSADLLANLFQDGQAASSINAQDLRDLIVSMVPSTGKFTLGTPVATTIAVAGTYVKAAGSTSLDSGSVDFDDDSGTNNRLKYTGAPARHVVISVSMAITTASNNQVIGFKLAKNGTVIDSSISRRKIGTGTDVGNIMLLAHADLVTGDYLEVFVTNETSASAITVENMHLIGTGLIA